jgi:GDPmannose 4,6-dehydratase
MPKTALITGITGQDGCYIAGILLKNGWKVCGTRRRGSSINNWRLVSESRRT